MSKGRTIKRNPIQLDASDYELNEQYFNFASFGGINSNKNFVDVNQYSFEDANNVYVDQNNQLHTRPPIKTMTIETFPAGWTPVDIVKVNNVTFYKLKNGSQYQYWFYYHDNWRNIWATEKSLVTYVNDYFVVFLETEIYLISWDYDENKIIQLQASNNDTVIYTPITKIVQGASVEEAESLNLLTTSEITRYLFEYGQEPNITDLQLVGKNVTVTIGSETYSFTFKQGNQIVFPEKLTTIDLSFNSTNQAARCLQSSYNGVILINLDDERKQFYLSLDGIVYSVYDYPEDFDENYMGENQYDLRLSDDGSQVWCAQAKLIETEINDNNEPNNYKYTTNVWYMGTPYISYTGWNKFEVELYEGHGDAENLIKNKLTINIAQENTDRELEGFSYAYYFMTDLVSVRLHCPEANNCAVVFHSKFDGVTVQNTSDTWEITLEQLPDGVTLDIDATSFVTFHNSKYIVNHSEFSLLVNDDGQNIDTDDFASLDPNSNLIVKYSIQNNTGLILLGCKTQYMRQYAHEADKRFYNVLVKENGLYYCYVNIDAMECAYCIGAFARTDAESSNSSPSSFIKKGTPVFPCYFTKFYAYDDETNDVDWIASEWLRPLYIDNRIVVFGDSTDIKLKWQDSVITVKLNDTSFTFEPVNYSFFIDNIVSSTVKQIANYSPDEYAYQFDYTSNVTNYGNRYTYPYLFYFNNSNNANDSYYNNNITNATTVILSQNDTLSISGKLSYDMSSNNLLSNEFYFYNGEIYKLLNNSNVNTFYPIYVSDDGQTIMYYSNSNNTLYSNNFTETVSIDIVTEGSANYVVPNFAEDFITATIVINNLIYQSENRSTEVTDDVSSHLQLYFPIDSKVAFVDKITNLVVFSQTSLGVFLEDLVYEYQYNNDNDAYILTPTKMQLGCIDGADILIGYDGSTIFMTQLKGLAGLNYQDFVQSTEQVYTYLTEAIMDLYDNFKGDRKIKLYQYKDWLFMYKQDNKILYIFDTRSSNWWKWTLPYAPQKILYDGDNLLLLLNNQIAIFDFTNEDIPYYDFIGNTIHWSFRSQKLHFNAPNNYKHIRQLNVITTQSGHELRYKLKFINYRNLNNLADTDTVDFEIDQLATLIKRVTFMKTNAFQFEISDDTTDDKPKYFETPDIAIKYRITERVR